MNIILKYFPSLSDTQKEQIAALYTLYEYWNNKINVISRKDINNLYERHILHSMSIAKIYGFAPNTSFLDLGTGGGFPGIPMAILLPQCQFLLVDSIGKKIKVASEVASAIGLTNVEFQHDRVENIKTKAEYIISRAVMPLPDLMRIAKKHISSNCKNATPNGIICLKGGEIQAEIAPFRNITEVTPLSSVFEEEFFETKKIVYVPV